MKLDITAHVHLHNYDSAQLNRIEAFISQLFQQGAKTMSAIGDFVTKQNDFNQRQSDAVDKAVQAVSGLQGDMKTMNDKLTALQNSQGTINPEDQALLDEAQQHSDAMTQKVEALATALQALDQLNPPAAPADTGGAPQIPTV